MGEGKDGIRLQKRLAQLGVASRREGERMITAGRVAVDGQVVTELGTRVGRGARIAVDGKDIVPGEIPRTIVYLVNKPVGYMCTRDDPDGRETVYALLPEGVPFMGYIGRLDYQTEGALLFTNDGELARALLSPTSDVPRVYEAKVRGVLGPKSRREIEQGVALDGRPTRPVFIERISGRRSKHDWLRLTLFEGKNRHVRRILEAVGHPVTRLRRISFAGVGIEDIPVGRGRFLDDFEVERLRSMASDA